MPQLLRCYICGATQSDVKLKLDPETNGIICKDPVVCVCRYLLAFNIARRHIAEMIEQAKGNK